MSVCSSQYQPLAPDPAKFGKISAAMHRTVYLSAWTLDLRIGYSLPGMSITARWVEGRDNGILWTCSGRYRAALESGQEDGGIPKQCDKTMGSSSSIAVRVRESPTELFGVVLHLPIVLLPCICWAAGKLSIAVSFSHSAVGF